MPYIQDRSGFLSGLFDCLQHDGMRMQTPTCWDSAILNPLPTPKRFPSMERPKTDPLAIGAANKGFLKRHLAFGTKKSSCALTPYT